MLTPLRIQEIQVSEGNYGRFTLGLIWQEAPLLLAASLAVILTGVPAWFIWVNTAQAPAASLLLLLGPIPVWTAFCYPLGRSAAGRTGGIYEAARALWAGYPRALATALPSLVVANMGLAAAQVAAGEAPLLVVAGATATLAVAGILTLVTLVALPTLLFFDLTPVRAWMYGLALTFRWPVVSLGLLALAFLLGLAARAVGPVAWAVLPMLLLPFNVTAVLLLFRRGYEREFARETDEQRASRDGTV